MTAYHHLYDTAHWHRLRLAQLQREPLCAYCASLGYTTAADTVDHIRPHRGDLALFYDADNLQSLCKPCHDKAKAILERHGRLIGADLNGDPLDPLHHWNR